MKLPLRRTLITLDKYNLNSYNNDLAILTINLKDYEGNPVIYESVDVYLDDVLLDSVTTDEEGYAVLTHLFNNRNQIGIHTFRVNECVIRFKVYHDTGWKDVTYQSGYSVHSSNAATLQYRCIDNVVQIVGEAKNNSAVSASSGKICSIPTDYTPARDVKVLTQGSTANKWLCKIMPTGGLTWDRYGTTSNVSSIDANQWFIINIMYTI